MKTFTLTYDDETQLDNFIAEHNINDNDKLLIQIFSSYIEEAEIKTLQALFSQRFPRAALIGATHDGTIHEGRVTIGKKTVISFSQFKKTTLKTAIVKAYSGASFDMGSKIGKQLAGEGLKVIITFSDGIHTNGEEYIKGLSSVNSDITISGGMAGDHGQLKQTFIFTQSEIYDKGAVAVGLFNKKLQVRNDYSFNWIPIGKHMTVTKAVDNHLFELDGISAVDIYEKYMGKELALRLPQIGIEFPLVLERDGIVIGRAVLDKKKDGSLTFAGNIHEGEQVRFGIGNVEQILRDSQYHASILSSKPVESIFIYSCMARRRFMGSYIDNELRPLQEIAPTVGFFTYGEFFHSHSKSQLLNETMTLLALSESSIRPKQQYGQNLVHQHHFQINPIHVLSHLANAVSKELELLNDNLESRVQENTQYILNQVYTDRLTNLPNRQRLLEDLINFKDKYLMLVNINDFTSINDFYGHVVGDTILRDFADLLSRCSHAAIEKIYKLPGDEYAIITTSSDVKETMSHLYDYLSKTPFQLQTHEMHISATIAAARIFGDGRSLANADMTLKKAKKENKTFMLFQKDLQLHEQHKENLETAKDIREALTHKNIVPFYQPIVDIKTGKIDKYECLARLVKKDGTVVPPLKFISSAQKIRLYFEIMTNVIHHAFETFKDNDLKFSINFNIEDILNVHMQEFFFNKVGEYNIGDRLTLEILETQALEQDSVVKAFIEKCQGYGITIAIDDFGSGYANFEHITRIKADLLKLDGSLIKVIDQDNNARLVVETLVLFAKKLNMKTIAEYVHSQKIYDIVKELGIDYAQGYLLGKPEASLVN